MRVDTQLADELVVHTDSDSRVLARVGRPVVQGHNAQAVSTSEQIIIAADITQQSSDSGQLEPMISQAVTGLEAIGVDDRVGTVLADGGYWNSPHITQLGQDGIVAIVPTKAATRTKARKLTAAGPRSRTDRCAARHSRGRGALRQRQHMIEPVFGNTKFNRRITRAFTATASLAGLSGYRGARI